MSQRLAIAARKRRRLITYAWVAALALGTIVLIYKEQTALLYILATLGVTALLVIVAVADLGNNKDLSGTPTGADPSLEEARGSAASRSRSRSGGAR
ncbi:MAG: hypothetical protein ABI596_03595 [Pyrinomonadaceae bacterium]